jgi:hypothetical protein
MPPKNIHHSASAKLIPRRLGSIASREHHTTALTVAATVNPRQATRSGAISLRFASALLQGTTIVRNAPEKQVIYMYSTRRLASVENEPVIFSSTESTAPVKTAHMARSLPVYGGGGE